MTNCALKASSTYCRKFVQGLIQIFTHQETGRNKLGSGHLFVCLFVCPCCVCDYGACAVNLADAVDWFLMPNMGHYLDPTM